MGPHLCSCRPKNDSWEHCGPLPLFFLMTPVWSFFFLNRRLLLLLLQKSIKWLRQHCGWTGFLSKPYIRQNEMQHCLFIIIIIYFPQPPAYRVCGQSWSKANPVHSQSPGCKSQTIGASFGLHLATLCRARGEDVIYLLNLQLGGGMERAKSLPEVLRGRQSCLIK